MKLSYFNKDIAIDIRLAGLTALLAVVALMAAIILVTREKPDLVITGDTTHISEAIGIDDTSKTGQVKTMETCDTAIADKNTETTATTESEQTAKNQEPVIRVYVSGCVKNSGVYKLKKGSIIEDAIKAAGGATTDADLENINLAYELNDNDMLKIPSKNNSSQQHAASSGTAGGSSGNNSSLPVIKDSGGAVAGDSSSKSSGGLININTATAEELETLPNIGVQTAKDIIEYREKNGGFKVITDIMKVPGIKESRFSKIKDKICIN